MSNDELINALVPLGVSIEDAEKMIQAADCDGDGEVPLLLPNHGCLKKLSRTVADDKYWRFFCILSCDCR